MIDSTMIRAHQHAAGAQGGQESQALGRSRGGFSSKIHVKVNIHGVPLNFVLTGGQETESKNKETLMGNEAAKYLIADMAYDSIEFREKLQEKGIQAVIPRRRYCLIQFEYDKHLYKKRNIIERFFNRLKQFRRIATRYDKTAIMFMGAVYLVAVLFWIKL